MKRLSLTILFLLSVCAFAQSLEVREAPDHIEFDPQIIWYETGLTIYNQTDSAIAVVAERVQNSVSGPQFSFFCWDVCYGATVNRSIGAIQIRPGKQTDAFTLTFQPENDASPVAVTMRFYNREMPSDYVEHTFNFTTNPTNVEDELEAQSSLAAPFPNPAQDLTQLNISLPTGTQDAALRLLDLAGKQVSLVALDPQDTRIQLPLQHFPNGIYFLALIADNQLISRQKLIIQK